MSLYQYLSHLAGIKVKLQKASLDIVAVHDMITEVKMIYKEEREGVDDGFPKFFYQSVRMAEKVGAEVNMPRITRRQQHRSNPKVSSPQDYYKKTNAIPLLDHIISTLDGQFSKSATVASSLLGLVPSVCCSKEIQLNDALEKYAEDLPSPELFPAELKRWRRKFMEQPADKRPSSPAAAIMVCDADMFPNVSILLQIVCTLAVTSFECERCASALRRLHNYMRVTMGKERLSDLALLHIHYDKSIDIDIAVDKFSKLHPRRLELTSLLKP